MSDSHTGLRSSPCADEPDQAQAASWTEANREAERGGRPASSRYDPRSAERAREAGSANERMVDALREHLRRYSGHQAVTNSLARLDDVAWLDAWEAALAATAGENVLFHGSVLGVLALRAVAQGAARVAVLEEYPPEARVAEGLIRRNQLSSWRDAHARELPGWSEERRRESFAAFTERLRVIAPDGIGAALTDCGWLVFPNVDHSLLGTGILSAIRKYREQGLPASARILPTRAKVFMMGVQWNYGDAFHLQPLNEFRWSLYPDTQTLPQTGWTALTGAVQIGEIEFGSFSETSWEIELPVSATGRMDALVYWFDLDLGSTRISNAPDGPLHHLRSAVQYIDSFEVRAGSWVIVEATLTETRLQLRTRPPPARIRSTLLPDWYVPMILDRGRNESFRAAIERAVCASRPGAVLDIGAGCGLLSMMAAACGAPRVYGCEVSAALSRTAEEVVRLNGFERSITLLNKDCRELRVPEDIDARCGLAVFEMFDCSLIGEGILHFLEHARKNLLEPGALLVPAAGRIHGAIVEYRSERALDVDVTLLNPFRFSPSFINVDARTLHYRALTEPFEVFSFDFAHATPEPAEKEIAPVVIDEGIAGGVLFWFDLRLDEQVWLSNAPDGEVRYHWMQGLQFLPERRVSGGTMPLLTARHDGSALQFLWRDGAAAPMAGLPRFDPQSQRQITELELLTQQLMQHCMSDETERARVADQAVRFALDPAAHGLEPKIAARFAAMFFGP